jgi:hypothetical protein
MCNNIVIQSTTKEEFSKLEEKTNLFLSYYGLKTQQIYVREGLILNCDYAVDIMPGKHGKIEEIFTIRNNKGILFRSTPDFTVIDIENTRYFITYNPEK